MQQLSGIDGLLYYAPVLFAQAGLSGSTSKFLEYKKGHLLTFYLARMLNFRRQDGKMPESEADRMAS